MSGGLRSSAGKPLRSLGAALLAAALALPVALVFAGAADDLRWIVLPPAAFEIGILMGLVGAIRHRPRSDLGKSALISALIGGAATTVGVAGGLAFAFAAVWSAQARFGVGGAPAAMVIVLGGFAGAGALAASIIGTIAVAAWTAWSRRRRTRLRLALTHALLVASMALAVIVAALVTAMDIGASFAPSTVRRDLPGDPGPAQTVLAFVVNRYVPSATAIFLLSLAVGLVIVPPAALVAFPVLGRATRRLETLAAATSALAAGDLAARSPVAGDDEIARLQADFNAMAASLERTQGELRAERDEVARLLADRRELVAAVSHELRTPLATLRGHLDAVLAGRDGAPTTALHRDLEIMAAETERLDRLIEDLFVLSRAEVGRLPLRLAPTPVAPLLERVAAAAAPLAWRRGRVAIVAEAPAEAPPVFADAGRLEQIVRNLLTNATRHTPPGGIVVLTTTVEAADVVIQVRDTGEGIAIDDLPRIWDRFFRSADVADRAGAGLGLALVKELTEAMGGTVAVASVRGEGSCFTIRLPPARPGD